MKRLTNGLKVWIAGSTLVGFLTGWSLLANMGTSAVATTTLAPTSQVTQSTQTTTQVSSLDTSVTATSTSTASSASASDNQSQSLQQISAATNVTSNVPRLRTSGS